MNVSAQYCPLLFVFLRRGTHRSEAEVRFFFFVCFVCVCLCVRCWHLSMCDYMSSILTACQNHWQGSGVIVASFGFFVVLFSQHESQPQFFSCSLLFKASDV